jgi:hypothetical protein
MDTPKDKWILQANQERPGPPTPEEKQMAADARAMVFPATCHIINDEELEWVKHAHNKNHKALIAHRGQLRVEICRFSAGHGIWTVIGWMPVKLNYNTANGELFDGMLFVGEVYPNMYAMCLPPAALHKSRFNPSHLNTTLSGAPLIPMSWETTRFDWGYANFWQEAMAMWSSERQATPISLSRPGCLQKGCKRIIPRTGSPNLSTANPCSTKNSIS